MSGNAKTMAVCPALEQRWEDALAAFDTRTETVPGLGVRGRADTVEQRADRSSRLWGGLLDRVLGH